MKRKGQSWTPAEDQLLTKAVQELSCQVCEENFRPDCPCETFKKKATWESIAKKISGRTFGGVQARWNGFLDPRLDNSPWTTELDQKLLQIYDSPNFSTWVLRARELSLPGKRRNGGDVAARYFYLVKKQKSKKSESAEEDEAPILRKKRKVFRKLGEFTTIT